MNSDTIKLGVDEFTLVLQYSVDKPDIREWEYLCEDIISEFLNKSFIPDVFECELVNADGKKPAGYTECLTLPDDKPFYLAIAWNPLMPTMGVILKFSAYAWAEYQYRFEKKYETSINVADFLQFTDSEFYSSRLSRIDITVDYYDYFDETFLNELYNRMVQEKTIQLIDKNHRVNVHKYNAVLSGEIINTLYCGSRGANTRSFLRIYNKKREQEETFGFRLNEAQNHNSWFRFEASFRSIYAHDISRHLKLISSQEEYHNYLKYVFLEKYRFFDKKKEAYCPWTDALIPEDTTILRCESPRNNSLKQSIENLLNNSGLFSTVAKVGLIFGEEAEDKFWNFLKKAYQRDRSYLINKKELQIWAKKNKEISRDDLAEYFK